MATCNKLSLPLVPITSTNIRLPVKKINYTSSDKKVSVTRNGVTIQYLVPCILLPYITELQQNLNQMTIQKAIYATALNHGIVIQQQQNSVQRYQYGVVTAKPHPLDYSFNDIFVLYKGDIERSVSLPKYSVTIPEYTSSYLDAQYIRVANDDGKTFALTINDINKNKIFGNIFTNFPCTVLCSTNNKYKKQQFGIVFLEEGSGKLIYLPYYYNKLKLYYFNLPTECSVLFDNIGMPVNHILNTIYPQLADNGSLDNSMIVLKASLNGFIDQEVIRQQIYYNYIIDFNALDSTDTNYNNNIILLKKSYIFSNGLATNIDDFDTFFSKSYEIITMNTLINGL